MKFQAYSFQFSSLLLLVWNSHTTNAFGVIPPSSTSSSSSSIPSTTKLYGAGATNSAANNVVLEPSYDDPTKFDSHSIGTARVHRYIRDDTEGEAEYVMWYHARGQEMQENDSQLPPLSTGSIGRATSNNGLIWQKCQLGSGSEDDGSTVSLSPNKESWWSFDTAHIGLGQVLLPMSTPAVLAEGGVYLMYFMGGNHEETNVNDYYVGGGDDDNDNDDTPTKTIKGMEFKVGICMSQDGLTWGRVEGDDPTGAIVVPTNYQDPNFDSNNNNDEKDTILEEELYVGWPDVMVNTDATNVLSVNSFEGNNKKGDEGKPPAFYMYYSTMLKETKEKCIGYAVSDDGFRWFKRGTCLKPSSSASDSSDLDANGCARSTVLRNQKYVDGIWQNAPGYTMYYEGISSKDGKHRILAATSDDAMNWTKVVAEDGGGGVALDLPSSSSEDDEESCWDSEGVGSPHLLRLDDGTIRMYYTGQGKDGRTAIGIATATAEEPTTFRREAVQFPSLLA